MLPHDSQICLHLRHTSAVEPQTSHASATGSWSAAGFGAVLGDSSATQLRPTAAGGVGAVSASSALTRSAAGAGAAGRSSSTASSTS